MILNQVCYRTLHLEKQEKLSSYQSVGGYNIWQKILAKEISANNILKEIKLSGLRGRGGAAFSTGIKLDIVSKYKTSNKYVICNADEGEPGTFKDRDILTYNPHQIIEGMAIIAYTIGASVGYIYIRGEYVKQIAIMESALREARKGGLIGNNINDTDINFNIYCFYGAGAYICGEETALLESMEGRRGTPRTKPPFPTEKGLYNSPTVVNNTETIASIPVILEKGSEWYTNLGVNSAKGYKIFSVSGNVNKPGNYEVPLGISFVELLELAGGMRDSKKLKAVIPGGISTSILPANIIMNLRLDYEPLIQAGSSLGTGAVIVIDEDACMVQILSRILQFYFNESCGQCTPCREGIGWLIRVLDRILIGEGSIDDLTLLSEIVHKISDNSFCALGDSVPIVAMSFLKYFYAEFAGYTK